MSTRRSPLAAGCLVATWQLFAAPIPAVVTSGAETSASAPTPAAPWELVLQWLTGERYRFAEALEGAHGPLLERARAEQPVLVERLSLKPPRTRATGYGLLPEILPDKPLEEHTARRQLYSLEKLTTAYARDLRDTGLLAIRAVASSASQLEPMVAEFERLKKRLENLEDHIDYHDFWQREAGQNTGFWARQNETLALVEQWHELGSTPENPARRDRLRQEIAERVAPFYPTKGLELERNDHGDRVLPIQVVTDINDEQFLSSFSDAVRQAFSESDAARASRFRVDLQIEILPVTALYPEGAPPAGSPLDEQDHVGRFPTGSLVLTTGARSTHAWTGRYIQLGSSPMPQRNLAHEFGHLLGFSDGYLRAYEGRPEDPFGVVVVEWKNLLEGLMGSPSRGRVTAEMIEQLLQAYGAAAP